MNRARGQASTEYLACAAALALALLAPIVEGNSVAGLLLQALARFHRNHIFLVAIS